MLPHLTGQHPHLLTEGPPQAILPVSHQAQATEVHLLTEVPAVPTIMAAEIQAPHTEARQAAPHTGVLPAAPHTAARQAVHTTAVPHTAVHPAASQAEDIPVEHPVRAEVAAAV